MGASHAHGHHYVWRNGHRYAYGRLQSRRGRCGRSDRRRPWRARGGYPYDCDGYYYGPYGWFLLRLTTVGAATGRTTATVMAVTAVTAVTMAATVEGYATVTAFGGGAHFAGGNFGHMGGFGGGHLAASAAATWAASAAATWRRRRTSTARRACLPDASASGGPSGRPISFVGPLRGKHFLGALGARAEPLAQSRRGNLARPRRWREPFGSACAFPVRRRGSCGALSPPSEMEVSMTHSVLRVSAIALGAAAFASLSPIPIASADTQPPALPRPRCRRQTRLRSR